MGIGLRLRENAMGYRPRDRASSKKFHVYAAETILGWRVVQKASGSRGDEMVARGLWREVCNEQYEHIGYQVLVPGMSKDVIMPSQPSSTGIARHEMEVNAGACMSGGGSKTAGLQEDKRISRKHLRSGKVLPPEDVVERIQAKVRVWPDVTAAKHDVLRVWPK